jgi:hypothetical protein
VLEASIKESFGGMDALKSEMSAKTIAVQGSGWGWLGYNSGTGGLTDSCCDCVGVVYRVGAVDDVICSLGFRTRLLTNP